MLTARPGSPPQRIDLNALCCAGAHLSPTWTSTMCPPSTSSASQTQRATRPRPDAYGRSAECVFPALAPGGVSTALRSAVRGEPGAPSTGRALLDHRMEPCEIPQPWLAAADHYKPATLLRDRTVREPRDLIKARACIDLLKEFAVAREAVRLFEAACLKQRVTVRRHGLIQMRGYLQDMRTRCARRSAACTSTVREGEPHGTL